MPKTLQLKNPATGVALPPIPVQEASIVAKAVEEARAAQKVWAALSFKQRAKHIMKIKRFLADNMDRACTVISQSNGKVIQDALATEVMTGILSCDWYANNTASALKSQKLASGSILFANKSNTLVYEPVGVVGIISPWNYPFSIPFGEIIMGLMAGNAILLKVATNTTHVGCFIEECISAGDLPAGLFRHLVIPGAEVAPAFFDAGINKLFFTGSVRVGKQLMAEASQTLTPLSLELGGNDAMVVLEDASIERAVNGACWAGYQNAGQSCGGVERVYVHASIYDAFVKQLIAKTKALRHGPDTGTFAVDIGSITTEGQYNTIKRQVDEAVAQGARIVAQSHPVGDCSKGFFYPATVLVGCTPSMTIMREETFGPVLPVVSFTDEEEAIRLANDVDLALTASVWSRNKKRARKFAHRLESGVVSVNDHLYSHGMAEAPWGGWKESGLGRTHGYLGLKEMCNVKCINEDCLPSGCAPRNLWWYPYDKTTLSVLQNAVKLIASKGICEWFSAVSTVVGNCWYMFKPWKVDTIAAE